VAAVNAISPPTATLADHIATLRRRRGLMGMTFSIVLTVCVLAAVLWPATYRSTATILIEQQEVPSDLVRSTISSYADQRIQVISQRVMTTANLTAIIQKYDLYAKDRRRKPREVIFERMRDDIKFQMISADVVDPRLGHPTKATIAFSVSYDNQLPEIAAKVANELTTLYLDENLSSRKQLASDTATFLTEEATRLGGQIAELEAKLAKFKESHGQDLPELTQLNIQLMSRTEDELREIETRIRSLDQQIVYLEAQLAQITPAAQIYTSTGERVVSPADRLKILKSDYSRLTAVYAPDHPDVLKTKREIEGLEREVGAVDPDNDVERKLTDAKSRLAEAEQRYSPDHPDVVRLKAEVAGFEAAVKAPAPPPSAKRASSEPDNPAYIQIKAQREASVNERASLETRRSQLRAKMSDFEQRLAGAPSVEREYSGMARELEGNQLKYRETRQKQMEAQLAQSLETERKGERFTLIEPPLVPEKPESPNRIVILVLGVILSLGAAVASAAVKELLDDTVRGRRDIERLLAVPPLAIVPWIETEDDRVSRKRRQRFTLVGAAGSVLIALTMVHLFYKPLDVLWHVALRKLG
jgi:uncharacterized protein involved in exopolysaccharide biosynthesis